MKAVKDRIFHAAMELFEQQGYENTSVEQITQRAGVSKGTFFTHFHSKDAVFSAIGRIFVEYFQEIVENGLRDGHSSRGILHDSIHLAATWCKENEPMIGQVMASGMYRFSIGSHATSNRITMIGAGPGAARGPGAGRDTGERIP